MAALVGALMLAGCGDEMEAHHAGHGTQAATTMSAQEVGGNRFYSKSYDLGDGHIVTYLKMGQNGRPLEIGVKMDEQALNNLPSHVNPSSHCVDTNGNGQIEPETECALGHDFVMPFPAETLALAKSPIKYAMVNYNPLGHGPAKIYDVAHFDLHFYVQSDEDRRNIRLGPCAEVINCEDLKTAQIPLPTGYAPAGFVDVGAVMGMMGNHLVDPNGEEFHGKPFSHTWIWGTYGGKITFLEPMITNSYLKSQPHKQCFTYAMPQKFSEAGYYPQKYCVDFNKGLNEYTVSLENFKYFGS